MTPEHHTREVVTPHGICRTGWHSFGIYVAHRETRNEAVLLRGRANRAVADHYWSTWGDCGFDRIWMIELVLDLADELDYDADYLWWYGGITPEQETPE